MNLLLGHYKALEWSEPEQKYVENPGLGILVEVDVRPLLCPGERRTSRDLLCARNLPPDTTL